MRPAALCLSSALLLAGSISVFAQALPPSGAGTANAINQSFQTQNQIRGLQQQQNFDASTNRLQNQTNQMYNAPRNYGPGVLPRGGRVGHVGGGMGGGVGGGTTGGGGRPERER